MARFKYVVNEETQTVTFPNGKVYRVSDVHADCQSRLAVHGLKQKLSDAMAVSADLQMTDVEKFAKAEEVFEALKQGQWNLRGEGGGGGSPFDLAASQYNAGNLSDTDIAGLQVLGLFKKVQDRAKILREREEKLAAAVEDEE